MKSKNIIILSACLLIAGIVAGWFARKGVTERHGLETVVDRHGKGFRHRLCPPAEGAEAVRGHELCRLGLRLPSEP